MVTARPFGVECLTLRRRRDDTRPLLGRQHSCELVRGEEEVGQVGPAVLSATGVANASMIQSAGMPNGAGRTRPPSSSIPSPEYASTGMARTRLIQKQRRMSASIAAAMRG